MTPLDREGRSPLHLAAGPEGDPEEVGRLLRAGADVALADRKRWTPLHFAAASNTWLEANHAPDDLRAIPLVNPVIQHTIGLVTSTAVERTPVIAELVAS